MKKNPNLDASPNPDPLEMTVPVKQEINQIVQQSHDAIMKLAREDAKTLRKNSFNLTKFAQNKALQNFILFGPESKRIDPVTKEYVSDWHILQRNKSWGFDGFDDLQHVDFETFWRQNIMDKYYRPYRDASGKWVGGYIEKRFEVDKWIPEGNNYQLPPGERRTARPPELGVIEGRLQAQRAKGGKNDVTTLKFEPNNRTKPFNWLTASSDLKKKVV